VTRPIVFLVLARFFVFLDRALLVLVHGKTPATPSARGGPSAGDRGTRRVRLPESAAPTVSALRNCGSLLVDQVVVRRGLGGRSISDRVTCRKLFGSFAASARASSVFTTS
jgi:hypothetical protein